jgi:PAS domain S-box-containing protein
MPTKPLIASSRELEAENRELRLRLQEAEETLRAIQSGEVDALVVSTTEGEQVFTLQGADRSYRDLIEQMNEGALTLTGDGMILYANQRFASMLGKPLEKVIGSSVQKWVFPGDQVALRRLLAIADAKTGRAELTLATSGGAGMPVLLSANRLAVGDSTDLLGVVVADLTEHKRAEDEIQELNRELERRVRTRTTQLENTNRELESFSWAISHELRAPLGAIDGLSRSILEGYGVRLPQNVREYLGMLRDNSRQMRQLLDDLLALSRFSRQALSIQEVEPAQVAREVFGELHAAGEDRQIMFTIGGPQADEQQALPPCQADPRLLKQIYRNLIANAIKFTRPRELACIEVGSTRQDGEQVYYVKDNGVGFDMKFAQKLFGVFQRLHSDSEFEGTGVGLAIVQRIVRLHGGRIWAEAEPDQGAIFYFTLSGA